VWLSPGFQVLPPLDFPSTICRSTAQSPLHRWGFVSRATSKPHWLVLCCPVMSCMLSPEAGHVLEASDRCVWKHGVEGKLGLLEEDGAIGYWTQCIVDFQPCVTLLVELPETCPDRWFCLPGVLQGVGSGLCPSQSDVQLNIGVGL
jgi:hypothetical protein